MLVVSNTIKIPLREFHFTFARSGGPGGQNVNKVNTKATLRWSVVTSPSISESLRTRFLEKYGRRVNQEGDLLVTSQRFRDQGRNVADCLEKLRVMLAAVAAPGKLRKKTRPTQAARQRRLQEKQAQSEKKQRRRSVHWED
ncbi:MAG: aminoacyl-tRNA hydrolase [Planctomycetales bacterium]|nr:aminoacyl-tRNA hydrolase [Planctomycetales bacterium]NIM08142.1 aminoacyl-tRNA hydrolase [Planctomycetales bacterium]NIN07635.1 aminoacyl-tRNA hydrolase [Planctomycetales bacterium]NIN76752.1 aminoacyl-tRNA hydrolase [Planctomycetales bacterium]NIO33961.1 aminoacyl-tRNA hydrolase [Planctomycetales bacterium]